MTEDPFRLDIVHLLLGSPCKEHENGVSNGICYLKGARGDSPQHVVSAHEKEAFEATA